jgi:hypothetical protein
VSTLARKNAIRLYATRETEGQLYLSVHDEIKTNSNGETTNLRLIEAVHLSVCIGAFKTFHTRVREAATDVSREEMGWVYVVEDDEVNVIGLPIIVELMYLATMRVFGYDECDLGLKSGIGKWVLLAATRYGCQALVHMTYQRLLLLHYNYDRRHRFTNLLNYYFLYFVHIKQSSIPAEFRVDYSGFERYCSRQIFRMWRLIGASDKFKNFAKQFPYATLRLLANSINPVRL